MLILKELYNNNIHPSGKFIKNGGPYYTLHNQLVDYMDTLSDSCTPAQKELSEKIADIFSDLNHLENEECFIEGFRMGAQIIWEIIHYQSDNFIQK